MVYKYIGKEKYLDELLNKQIRQGDFVEKKKLKDSYYVYVKKSLEEIHASKSKIQLIKSIECKELQIEKLKKEVGVLKELYDPSERKIKKGVKK